MKKLLITLAIVLTAMAILAGCTSGQPTASPTSSPAPAKLAFTTQPVGGVGGTPLTTQPVVTIQDANGNTVAGSFMVVTLTITAGTGTSGAVLFGPSTINATNGVAKFTNILIDKAGNSYTLTATSGKLAQATSAPFAISSGGAAKLFFSAQPGGAVAGSLLTTQPQVMVQDDWGNVVAGYDDSVTLFITPGSGPSAARLSGTTTIKAVNGIAKYTDISIQQTWTSYTLMATSDALESATSIAFGITPGQPAKLEVTVQPEGAVAGLPFETQPKVAVEDINGNVVTSSNFPITISLTPGTGATGAKLSGTTTIDGGDGLAVFEDLAINLAGTGYKLTATTPGLTSASSVAFDVVAK